MLNDILVRDVDARRYAPRDGRGDVAEQLEVDTGLPAEQNKVAVAVALVVEVDADELLEVAEAERVQLLGVLAGQRGDLVAVGGGRRRRECGVAVVEQHVRAPLPARLEEELTPELVAAGVDGPRREADGRVLVEAQQGECLGVGGGREGNGGDALKIREGEGGISSGANALQRTTAIFIIVVFLSVVISIWTESLFQLLFPDFSQH